jgi:WD40 repeat protein
MTRNSGSDRQIFDFLARKAGHGSPDYLDDILSLTARSRQRPAWTSIERWLPLDISAHRSVIGRRTPVRSIAVLVVVALLIAALVAVAAGTRRPTVQPFGLARDGALVSSHDGDIFAVDPVTHAERAIITDPHDDFGLTFSRDGTKFMFLRVASGGCEPNCALILAVANADGSDVRELSPAVDGLDWQDWSPDGRQIAFLSRVNGVNGDGLINVVNVDGTGLKTLAVGRPAHEISWLPPDGREIVFRGEQLHDTDPLSGIFAVHPDGTDLRPISTTPALDKNDYQEVAVSPDGTQVATTRSVPDQGGRIQLIDLRTGHDRLLPAAPDAVAQQGAVFSPDGLEVVYLRWYADTTSTLVVAPTDGSGPGVSIGPRRGFGSDGPYINNYAFTPDGKAVIANDGQDKVTRLLPIDGSASSILSTGELAFAAYQRVAP